MIGYLILIQILCILGIGIIIGIVATEVRLRPRVVHPALPDRLPEVPPPPPPPQPRHHCGCVIGQGHNPRTCADSVAPLAAPHIASVASSITMTTCPRCSVTHFSWKWNSTRSQYQDPGWECGICGALIESGGGTSKEVEEFNHLDKEIQVYRANNDQRLINDHLLIAKWLKSQISNGGSSAYEKGRATAFADALIGISEGKHLQ